MINLHRSEHNDHQADIDHDFTVVLRLAVPDSCLTSLCRV